MNGVQRLLCGLLDLITGKGGVQLMAMFFCAEGDTGEDCVQGCTRAAQAAGKRAA